MGDDRKNPTNSALDRGPGVDADEEATRALASNERKRFKSAKKLVAKLRKGTLNQASGAVMPPIEFNAPRDLPADLPQDLPEEAQPARASDTPRSKTETAQLGDAGSLGGIGTVDLHAKPTKKTVRAARPALAGTGDTEAYRADQKAEIQRQIDTAKGRKSPARRTSGKLIVKVDGEDSGNTWISGSVGGIPEPRIQHCNIGKRTTEGFAVKRVDGTIFMLPISRALAVAVGVVLDHPRVGTETVFLDVVTSWGNEKSGPVVLRFDATNLPLRRLIGPTTGHIAAIKMLAAELATSPKCRRMPNRPDWPGPPFERYDNAMAMNVAFYGQAGVS